jgi:CheY-like chemotaxis protein
MSTDTHRLVLIVDPDDDTRSLYRETLRLVRCDVAESLDGRDALAKALVRPPTLVITELRLPLVDGFAFCDILRRDRTTANVPILIVTAESRAAELDRARQVADAVLVKPTTPDALLHEIQRLTTCRDERREPPTSIDATAVDGPQQRPRTVLAKAHLRTTTTSPAVAPPPLTCPSCDRPLTYVQSHIGGVSERHSEQWDYFTCSACGGFQYRHRTRKLRALGNNETQSIKTITKGH